MKHLDKYEKFNEGKISQFFIKKIAKITGNIINMVKKIKGDYFELKLKNKELDKKFQENIIKVFDYSFFDSIKYLLSKKFKNKLKKSPSFSAYLKRKEGFDIYESLEILKNIVKIDNFVLSKKPDERSKQLESIKSLKDYLKSIENLVDSLDDKILKEREIKKILDDINKKLKSNSFLKESVSNKEEDIKSIVKTITDKFSEEYVVDRFDNELLEWVDNDWEEDGYDSEYDWYIDHSNDEAQDVVLGELIDWYRDNHDGKINDYVSEVFYALKSHYGI